MQEARNVRSVQAANQCRAHALHRGAVIVVLGQTLHLTRAPLLAGLDVVNVELHSVLLQRIGGVLHRLYDVCKLVRV